jgi:hypothetical protein
VLSMYGQLRDDDQHLLMELRADQVGAAEAPSPSLGVKPEPLLRSGLGGPGRQASTAQVAPQRDPGPDQLDHAERPGSGEEAVDARE